ncbi:MAG: tetratricopeptide repeat protein [Candidatus Nanopelagicales bacterium]
MSTPNPAARVPLRGAVDLAAIAAAREAQAKAEERLAQQGGAPTASALVLDVDEAGFQAVVDLSFRVPVVVDFWATWCQPCTLLSPILERLAVEGDGAWVLAKVDVDANPRIGQAFQVQSIPTVFAIVKGQPVPLFQGALPEPQVRQYLEELLRVAEANGVTGRIDHDGAVEGDADAVLDDEPAGDPRFDAAYDAIENGDWDAAEAAYNAVLAQSPADADAKAGLAQVALLRRTDGADPEAAFAAADAAPESLEAQALAADIELLTGRVDESFDRIIALVRRTSGDERAAARDHLLGLFLLVGDDPRVTRARAALASALF